jgi:hypothetical protein
MLAFTPPIGLGRTAPLRGIGSTCRRGDGSTPWDEIGGRAGAMQDFLYEISRQTVADADLILRDRPPLSCRGTQLTTKGRLTPT